MQNILVVCKGPDWWVKIADFGISKRAIEGFTALRTLTGTPAFAAPEILGFIQSGNRSDDSYTNAVDIWSLGVITFLILTGETLFKDQRRLGQYVAGTFTFPSHTLSAKQVGGQGCAFVRSLMAPKSEDRPGAKESLQHPWLDCLTEPETPESQRYCLPYTVPKSACYTMLISWQKKQHYKVIAEAIALFRS
jgi:serine/threonine protein kinase